MRRVALGSGLDLGKLASTIRQVASSDPPLPVMICQAESNPAAWVHLSLALGLEDDLPTPASSWEIILGYPLHEGASALATRYGIAMPAGAQITEWEEGLQATIHIPFETALDDIAQMIQSIMIAVQRVDPTAAVELALEYP